MNIISDFTQRQEEKFTITNINNATTISNNDILHRYDSFDPMSLPKIYENLGKPKYVISDYYVTVDKNQFGSNVYTVPAWAAEEARKYLPEDCNENFLTKYNAYIACNSKRINRYLGLKLAEWFKTNFFYTWSGTGAVFDLSEIITELDSQDSASWMSAEARNFLLAPITLKPNWINAGNDLPPEQQDGHRIMWDPQLDNYHSTGYNWRYATREPHSRAAVVLITEAVLHQKAAIITEKTVQTILGANFPLWIGGYGQADAMEQVGFDVFHDIVDHSYQYLPTLIERCWFAFERNLKLLTDLAYASNVRLNARDRLIANQKLLLHGQIDQYCVSSMSLWPEPARSAASLLYEWKYGLPLTATF
jgi:hypothetical protein